MSARTAGAAVPVLWQIRHSVYVEKVRWALDVKRVPHRRRTLAPGLHGVVLWSTGRGATVPALDVGGRRVRGSARIVDALEERWPEPPLMPGDEAGRGRVRALQEEWDRLGHDVRCVALEAVLSDPARFARAFAEDLPGPLGTSRAGVALSERFVRRRYGIGPAQAARAELRVRAALDRLVEVVEARPFLVGGRLTAADLTVAAMLSPLVWPAEQPGGPFTGGLPEDLAARREAWARHPVVDWALGLYAGHRVPVR